MAKIPAKDPRSGEITSPLIASMSEGLSAISEALDLKTKVETGVALEEVYISESDRFRVFQAPAGKRLWLTSPAPVIKKGGTVVSGYTVDGGGIVFDRNLADADGLTADVTYVLAGSAKLDEIPSAAQKNIWSGKATTATYTATLTIAGWVAGTAPYAWRQSVNVAGILAADSPITGQMLQGTTADAIEAEREAMGCVTRITTAAGSITAFCVAEKPAAAIKIQMKAVR